jgi:hypothetical protein
MSRLLTIKQRVAMAINMSHNRAMNAHKEIIANWPQGVEQFAADVGVKYETARKWRVRNAIPPIRWLDVLQAAQLRGVDVTLKDLRETTISKHV